MLGGAIYTHSAAIVLALNFLSLCDTVYMCRMSTLSCSKCLIFQPRKYDWTLCPRFNLCSLTSRISYDLLSSPKPSSMYACVFVSVMVPCVRLTTRVLQAILGTVWERLIIYCTLSVSTLKTCSTHEFVDAIFLTLRDLEQRLLTLPDEAFLPLGCVSMCVCIRRSESSQRVAIACM